MNNDFNEIYVNVNCKINSLIRKGIMETNDIKALLKEYAQVNSIKDVNNIEQLNVINKRIDEIIKYVI